jgi:hypothetical protein
LEKARFCNDSSFYYNSSPETFIAFFDAYPMFTRKSLDYLDFKKFYLLKTKKQKKNKNKHYLTEVGFKEMNFIAMNRKSGPPPWLLVGWFLVGWLVGFSLPSFPPRATTYLPTSYSPPIPFL